LKDGLSPSILLLKCSSLSSESWTLGFSLDSSDELTTGFSIVFGWSISILSFFGDCSSSTS
jgi:hypothetical protein